MQRTLIFAFYATLIMLTFVSISKYLA